MKNCPGGARELKLDGGVKYRAFEPITAHFTITGLWPVNLMLPRYWNFFAISIGYFNIRSYLLLGNPHNATALWLDSILEINLIQRVRYEHGFDQV